MSFRGTGRTTTSFGESAGTAFTVANVFRMAVMHCGTFGKEYVECVMRKMEAVEKCVDEDAGLVAPVVDPVKDD